MSIENSHANKRARQRLGLSLTEADVAEIWRKIDTGAAGFMSRNRGLERYGMTLHGKALQIVVNARSRRLVTVMDRPGRAPRNRRPPSKGRFT